MATLPPVAEAPEENGAAAPAASLSQNGDSPAAPLSQNGDASAQNGDASSSAPPAEEHKRKPKVVDGARIKNRWQQRLASLQAQEEYDILERHRNSTQGSNWKPPPKRASGRLPTGDGPQSVASVDSVNGNELNHAQSNGSAESQASSSQDMPEEVQSVEVVEINGITEESADQPEESPGAADGNANDDAVAATDSVNSGDEDQPYVTTPEQHRQEVEKYRQQAEAEFKQQQQQQQDRAADDPDFGVMSPRTANLLNIPEHIRRAHLEERKQQAVLLAAERSAKMRQIVVAGNLFMKYGRNGSPHQRYVCASHLGNIHWDKKPMDPSANVPSQYFFPLKNVVKILKGKETYPLCRKNAKNAPANQCFSVISIERTLDLQADSEAMRDLWVLALESVVKDVQMGMIDLTTGEMRGDADNYMPTPAGSLQYGSSRFSTTVSTNSLKSPRRPQLVIHSFSSDDEKAPFARKGGFFFKFERHARPYLIHLNVDDGKLFFGKDSQPSTRPDSKWIPLTEIIQIRSGKHTDVFRVRSTNALSPPEHCFSIICINEDSSFDLQAENNQIRNNWAEVLTFLTEAERRRAGLPPLQHSDEDDDSSASQPASTLSGPPRSMSSISTRSISHAS